MARARRGLHPPASVTAALATISVALVLITLAVASPARAAATGGSGAAATTAASAGAPFEPCAWRFVSSTFNIAFPDTNATYWMLPYALGAQDALLLDGWYPAARYMSLNTYGSDLDTVDTLRDDELTPDAGSGNPFQDGAFVDSPPDARRWSARVVPSGADHTQNQMNGLPSDATQALPVGLLVIRVYVPTDAASPEGGVPLPEVTLSLDDGAQLVPLPTCTAPSSPLGADIADSDIVKMLFTEFIANAASASLSGGAPDGVFVNPASTAGLLPNGDNKYIGAKLRYQPNRLFVIRAKAPLFPDTRAGQPPTAPQQLRYWSMCQNDLVSPYPVVACAADFQTALDATGSYTYVLGADGEVPSRAQSDPTVTLIPWGSTATDKVVFLRNMLPADDFFTSSVQYSQATGTDPAQSMGVYYPRSTYCQADVYQSGGVAACFGAAVPVVAAPSFTG